MVEVMIPIGQLILHIDGYTREPSAPYQEVISLDVAIENRASGLGDARQPPAAELRDEQGRTHPLTFEEAWSEPLQPDTAVTARLMFEVPLDATALELVLAAGTDEEVSVPLT
jgi:hypothetical protein